MGKSQLTRRQMLASLAGASGIGAGLGSGTAAVVSDEAVFPLGSITSGRLEIDVARAGGNATGSGGAAEISLNDLQPEGTVDLSVSMPELPGGSNNPARIWLGVRCPIETALTRALEVTVRRRNCQSGCTEFEGTLSDLAGGVAIEAPGGDCLQPEETVELGVDFGLSDFEGTGSGTVVLEVVGTQCRNGGSARNPFDGNVGCGTESSQPRSAISFVGFCSSEAGPIEPTFGGETWLFDGVGSVEWSTETPVDFVVVKAGRTFTIYDHSGYPRTEGEVFSGDAGAAVPGIEPHQRNAARPCELAVERLGYPDYEAANSTKRKPERGEWVIDE